LQRLGGSVALQRVERPHYVIVSCQAKRTTTVASARPRAGVVWGGVTRQPAILTGSAALATRPATLVTRSRPTRLCCEAIRLSRPRPRLAPTGCLLRPWVGDHGGSFLRYRLTAKSCATRAGRLKLGNPRAMSSSSKPKNGITWPMMTQTRNAWAAMPRAAPAATWSVRRVAIQARSAFGYARTFRLAV
jgi:hypothetical protein